MSPTPTSPRRGAAGRFLLYVVRHYALSRWALALTFVLLVLEYATISLMIPLSSGGASRPGGNARVVEAWTAVVQALGLQPVLMTWVWLFLLLLAARSLAGYGHLLLTTYVAKQVHRCLSENVFWQVLAREPMTGVYKRSIGHYVSLAGDDTFRAGSLVHSALLILAGALSAGAGLVLLYVFSLFLFAGTIGFLVVSAVLVFACLRWMLRLNAASVALSREAGTGFLEALNSLRSIRSMGGEAFAHLTYRAQMQRYTKLLFEVDALKAGVRTVPGLVALLAGIIGLGPWWSSSTPYSAGEVFAATTIIIRVFVSLGSLMTAGGAFLVDARAAKDLAELASFSNAPGRPAGAALQPVPSPSPDRLDLVGLDYRYHADAPVLHELDFSFHRGQVHAVIGPSGSGKSTLADLLLGLVDIQGGRILADGRPLSAAELRNRVILVEQQPRIFSVSIRDNLTLGLVRADEELTSALAAVDMLEFVRALPQGLHTVLDYQGANLSGGQRQRLSIARALIRHPQILILDEATSALDPTTRDSVMARVKAVMRDGIVILITHDETLAALSDSVLALKPQQVDDKVKPTP